MPEYTLRIRRYSPESGEAAHWQDYEIDLDGHRSVLDGILQAKDRQDGSIGIRCSCRAAICGSCGVRINGISPGPLRTELMTTRLSDPEYVRKSLERLALKRVGTPEDVVGAALFLASPAAAWITGHILGVDGGWLAR